MLIMYKLEVMFPILRNSIIIFIFLAAIHYMMCKYVQVQYVSTSPPYIHPIFYEESNQFHPYYRPNDTKGVALRRCKKGHCEVLSFYKI